MEKDGSPADAYLEYRDFLDGKDIPFRLRVLHPRLEVAVARGYRRCTEGAVPIDTFGDQWLMVLVSGFKSLDVVFSARYAF